MLLIQQLVEKESSSSNSSSRAERNLSTPRTRISRINDLPALRIEEIPPTTGEILILQPLLPPAKRAVRYLPVGRELQLDLLVVVEDEEAEDLVEEEATFQEEEADKGMEIDKIVLLQKVLLPPVRVSRVITKEVDIEEEEEVVEMYLEEDGEMQEEVDLEDRVEQLVGLEGLQREQRHRLLHLRLLLLLHLLPMPRTRFKCRKREALAIGAEKPTHAILLNQSINQSTRHRLQKTELTILLWRSQVCPDSRSRWEWVRRREDCRQTISAILENE